MVRRRWTVGVDFGGTNIKVGLLNPRGRIVKTELLSSQQHGSPADFLRGISRSVERLSLSFGIRPRNLRGIGIGAPGVVDVRRGIVRSCVNVLGWHDVPLKRQIERRLRCRCVIDNDANLVALGEWRFGAGKRAPHIVCLTLGTGVGGGIILQGRVYHGASGAAGEIGHMAVNPRGRRCGCGSRGCFEAQVAKAAIVSAAKSAIRRGAKTLRLCAKRAGSTITPLVVCEAAEAGDRAAKQIWDDIGMWLGVGISSLINVLSPDRVVIGGGIASAWKYFHPALMRKIREQAMEVSARRARIVRAQLGGRAGVLGAAVLVWDSNQRVNN